MKRGVGTSARRRRRGVALAASSLAAAAAAALAPSASGFQLAPPRPSAALLLLPNRRHRAADECHRHSRVAALRASGDANVGGDDAEEATTTNFYNDFEEDVVSDFSRGRVSATSLSFSIAPLDFAGRSLYARLSSFRSGGARCTLAAFIRGGDH